MTRIFNQAELAELVIDDAQQLASELASKDENTKSQMRRFYQEFVKIRQGIPSGDEDAYKKNEVALKMLVAKVAYASARKAAKVDPRFKNWIDANIKAIKCAKDVNEFGDYYEAFIGFFYAAQPQNDQRQGGYRR